MLSFVINLARTYENYLLKLNQPFLSLSLASLAVSSLLVSHLSYAAKSPGDIDITNDPAYKKNVTVPFIFGTDSIGFAGGVGALFRGVGQPQASLLGAAFVSNKHSYAYYFSANNYQIGDHWLWYLDGYQGRFVEYDYYTGEATDNDSDENDSIEVDGMETRYRMRLKYVLPLAAGSDGASAYYTPEREVTGHTPWESGVTSIEFQPFYKKRDLSDVRDSDLDDTWGMTLGLEWDNRNDTRNPSEGSYSLLSYTYAPEQGDVDSWQTVELQNSHYWDLGAWDGIFNQQVFAFDFYTGVSPNAGECDDGTCHQAPEYAGMRLGGLYHLRSYATARYTGNAAIHYSAEYRVKPEWQPLGDWPIFNWYNIPWWQWTLFADVGRVADDYDLSELHEDMKWSAGGGVRFQIEGVVIRTEMAWGQEDSMFRVMVNQTF